MVCCLVKSCQASGYLFNTCTMRFIYSLCCLLIGQWNILAQSSSDSLRYCTEACCCAKDYAPVGMMISHVHEKGQWMLSYRYSMSRLEGNQSGTDKMLDEAVFTNYLLAPSRMNMQMHMLMGMYGLTPRITLMAMFSYMQQSMLMEMFPTGSSHHHGSDPLHEQHAQASNGMGDTRLYVLWGLPNCRSHQFMINLGLSMPTGSIIQKGNANDVIYAGRHLPYSMQLGSGSLDILPGLTYLYRSGKWSVGNQLSAVMRYFDNKLGYRRGHEASFNSWVSYRCFSFFSSSLRMEASVSGAIVGQDKNVYAQFEPAADPHNYGGHFVSLYGGTLFHPTFQMLKQHRFGIEMGLPVYQYVQGVQQRQQFTVFGSWIVMF